MPLTTPPTPTPNFCRYVEQVDAAAEARQAEFEARKREQNVKARLVLEEQIQERQAGAGRG